MPAQRLWGCLRFIRHLRDRSCGRKSCSTEACETLLLRTAEKLFLHWFVSGHRLRVVPKWHGTRIPLLPQAGAETKGRSDKRRIFLLRSASLREGLRQRGRVLV